MASIIGVGEGYLSDYRQISIFREIWVDPADEKSRGLYSLQCGRRSIQEFLKRIQTISLHCPWFGGGAGNPNDYCKGIRLLVWRRIDLFIKYPGTNNEDVKKIVSQHRLIIFFAKNEKRKTKNEKPKTINGVRNAKETIFDAAIGALVARVRRPAIRGMQHGEEVGGLWER
jgi:hypothetical protein